MHRDEHAGCPDSDSHGYGDSDANQLAHADPGSHGYAVGDEYAASDRYTDQFPAAYSDTHQRSATHRHADGGGTVCRAPGLWEHDYRHEVSGFGGCTGPYLYWTTPGSISAGLHD